MKNIHGTMSSPIGELLILSNGDAITWLCMELRRYEPKPLRESRRDDAWFAQTRKQLRAYFAGELTEFDLPLAAEGTPFQQRVWTELRKIPYGATISYAELARRAGNPKAPRAAGAANGRNPISIIIPCHRVIGSNKSLTDYGGGLERKKQLLDLEAATTYGSDGSDGSYGKQNGILFPIAPISPISPLTSPCESSATIAPRGCARSVGRLHQV
jgi:methylated-DNA-[protein]-cysteine S-methyltransferase